ncbi:MAG: endo-1,4-beta-xylanase [Ardenticatenaceae bacterium]
MNDKFIFVGLISLFLILLGLMVWLEAPEERVKLKNVAQAHGIEVGLAVHPSRFNDVKYANTVRQEFSSVTPEVAMKFEVIHPCPPPALTTPTSPHFNLKVALWVATNPFDRCNGSYRREWNWRPMDEIVAWAEANGLTVYGHTMLWHMQNPPWVAKIRSPEGREWVMKQHIETIISRYCNDPIVAYDIVNEGMAPDGNLLPLGPWYDIPNYVDHAFRYARTALDRCQPAFSSPELAKKGGNEGGAGRRVKLFYNDWDFEYGRTIYYDAFVTAPGEYNKSDAIYNYLSPLLSGDNPTPIDGLGMQTHLTMSSKEPDPHDTEQMVAIMTRFAELGLEIKITEVDVPIYAEEPIELYEEQAAQFGGIATACRLVPACTGFATWGLRDAQSWRGAKSSPLMFTDEPCDDTYCPKPAYFAVREAWK